MCILALFPGEKWRRLQGYWNRCLCAASQGRNFTDKELPYIQNGLPPMVNVMLIVSTKFRSARGASHQRAFMSGCLTISHACLPCLPSERTLLFWRDLCIIGREVSWERWESIELGRWERYMTGMRWQGGKSV